MNRLTVENALDELAQHDATFIKLFSHGSLEVEIYKPEGTDPQQPHTRDELYVVATGTGHFIKGDDKQPVSTGEVLFAPAGVEHRFVDFTDDFSTWVFFYGPEGGEASQLGAKE